MQLAVESNFERSLRDKNFRADATGTGVVGPGPEYLHYTEKWEAWDNRARYVQAIPAMIGGKGDDRQ